MTKIHSDTGQKQPRSSIIDKCMKSYKKVVGVFVDLPAMNTISKEERKQIVLEWKNKIAEKKNC